MAVSETQVRQALGSCRLAGGRSVLDADLVRALRVRGDVVQFVLEAADPEVARRLEPLRSAAQAAVVALTAHGPTGERFQASSQG